ncbi:hypothetical protein J6590_014018 [Homalodisca vitripennis]|nr:hypothetical protein J6590_014018 [Homalodisca vitripennis]
MVCTNLDQDKITVEVINTGLSDHTGQFCTLDYTVKRLITHNNLLSLKHLLSKENWDPVINSTGIKTQEKRKKGKLISYSRETATLKKEFLKAQDKYLLTGSEIDKQTASALKKTYDQKLKQSRQEANARYVHQADNKSKAIWNTINNERQRKTEPETTKLEIHHDTGLLTDTEKIANCFNKHFSDIAEESLKANNINSNPVSTTSLVQSAPRENLTTLHPTTADEMSRVLRSLRCSTSSGTDGISTKILQYCGTELIEPLVEITNMSLEKGIFPSKLK